MRKRTKAAAVVAGAVVIAGVAGGVAVATGDDGDVHVTGPEAKAAREAALDAMGGGTAGSVERDDEDGATWEVEVTREGGGTVDVRLDEDYRVVVIEGDHETGDD